MKMVTANDLLTQKFVSCDVEDRVSSLLGKLKRTKESAAVVFEKGKYLGVVTKDAFLVSRESAKTMRVRNIAKKRSNAKTPFYVAKLSPKDSLSTICKKFSSSDARLLPIIDKRGFAGVVRASDVLSALSNSYAGVEAFSLATMDPATLSEDDTLDTALSRMKRAKAGHLPVVDDKGNLSGMFSSHDYMTKHINIPSSIRAPSHASHGKFKNAGFDAGEKVSLGHIKVSEMMSEQCCTATPRTKIPAIIRLMIDDNVLCVVLTRRNKPVGIITSKDIFSDAAKA